MMKVNRLGAFAALAPLAALASLVVLVLGCGGGAPQQMPGPPDGAVFTACANDSRADAYAAGMVKPGKESRLTVQLMTSEPGPPVKGNNAWIINVKDAAGAPVEGATIGVTLYMPDHNHGSSVKAVVEPQAAGDYSITPLNFFMAGLWQTTLQIQSADKTVSDSVVFAFCVQG